MTTKFRVERLKIDEVTTFLFFPIQLRVPGIVGFALSNVDGTPLNTVATADAATAYYGAITHPTIEDIAIMAHKFLKDAAARDSSLRYEDLRLWTMDLKGADTLLSFQAEYVGLFGMLLTDDLVYLQLAASWSTRYGKICRVMRPFCSALYRLAWGRTDPHALFAQSAEAVVAIQCWRAMLCLIRHREVEFTRAIASFAPETPTVVAEFDSSLSGAGLIWYSREGDAEVAVGVGAADLLFLGFGEDSSFQNLSEFLGAILAVLGHIALGCGGRSVALRGDSVTALTWAITERPRGERVTKAAMVFSLLCIAAGVDVKEVTHIAGTDNKRCDQLSRRGRTPATSILDEAEAMGVRGVDVVEIDGDKDIVNLLNLCDPRSELHSEEEFIGFWSSAKSAIDSFLLRYSHRGQQTLDPHESTVAPPS